MEQQSLRELNQAPSPVRFSALCWPILYTVCQATDSTYDDRRAPAKGDIACVASLHPARSVSS